MFRRSIKIYFNAFVQISSSFDFTETSPILSCSILYIYEILIIMIISFIMYNNNRNIYLYIINLIIINL